MIRAPDGILHDRQIEIVFRHPERLEDLQLGDRIILAIAFAAAQRLGALDEVRPDVVLVEAPAEATAASTAASSVTSAVTAIIRTPTSSLISWLRVEDNTLLCTFT